MIEDIIAAARGDVARLGWIREQLLQHVEIPDHWDIHERVLKQVLAEERRGSKTGS